MTIEPNSNSNHKPESQSQIKSSAVARWIVGGFFTMFASVNGFHYSSVFLLVSAFLMFPLPFAETFLQKRNIKAAVVIILSVVLFFAGVITSPLFKSIDLHSSKTVQSITNTIDVQTDNLTKSDNTVSNDSTTTEPDNTTSGDNDTTEADNTNSNDEQSTMVWVSSSGHKYHSKPSCSNMSSPSQIPLEDAQKRYEPCKKCY